jgi:hypothetical protein
VEQAPGPAATACTPPTLNPANPCKPTEGLVVEPASEFADRLQVAEWFAFLLFGQLF